MAKQFHPVAELFPLMAGAEFDALKADIAENGLREAIWLHPDGRIVDGRNRYNACMELGVVPVYRAWDGQGSLVTFVVSLNLHRRHLDTGQRGMVAARLANMRQGRQETNGSIDLFVPQSEAAELLNVSVPSVKRAKEVIEQGTPELVEKVEKGEVSVSAAASVATLPFVEQREIVARGVKEILAAAKQIRQTKQYDSLSRKRTIAQSLPPKTYNVILADPPWEYSNTGLNGAAATHYDTMSINELSRLLDRIGLTVADNAVLFLWVTNPLLEESFTLIKEWGFRYKTNIVWVKDRIGTGFYVRGIHEMLLICIKGSFTPINTNQTPPITSALHAPTQEHSRKPDRVYEIIESLYPGCNYIELFARRQRPGWDSWGDGVQL